MSISVVMVSYHTGSVLFTAIASVLQQEDLAELVLIDNGNPPDVFARVQQMSLVDPRLKIISGHGNIGFAAGCNKGARATTGEYITLLNPDCILPPQALKTLVEELKKIPDAVIAGPHLVNPDGSEQRGGRRHLLTPMVALVEALGLSRLGLRGLNNSGNVMPDETHVVEAISGACMCMRKSDYEALSGLDEGYFLHVEDLDVCIRVARAGKRIVCVPKVKVAHLLSTSGSVTSEFIEGHKAKGFVRYFEKHFADNSFIGVLPLLKAAIWARYTIKTRVLGRKSKGDAAELAASRKLMILASSLVDQGKQGNLSGKTVLVTGATSQVGVYVVKHLLQMGAAVLAVSREEPLPFAHPRLKWLKADLTRDDFSLGGFLADATIHCAPQWFLPKVLPLIADAETKHVVAIGSTSIYSKAASHNAFEKNIVAKHTLAEAEIARLSGVHNMSYTILRPTMIYGVGLDQNISSIARFIERFGRFFIYPPAMGRRQPVHAEDIALAALQAAYNPQAFNKSYNVSGGEVISYYNMLVRIFRVLGKEPKIVATSFLPFAFSLAGVVLHKAHVTGDMAHRMNEDLVFFHHDAAQDFGYNPRKFLSAGKADL